MLQPLIVDKPELKVIGIEAPFISVLSPDATNAQVIGPLWDKFLHLVKQIPNRVGNAMFGVIDDVPESKRSHPHEMMYLASVPVSALSTVPAGMIAKSVPPATFAVFTHRGPIRNIGHTVREIYSVFGASSVIEQEVFPEDHQFWGKRGIPFVARHLRA